MSRISSPYIFSYHGGGCIWALMLSLDVIGFRSTNRRVQIGLFYASCTSNPKINRCIKQKIQKKYQPA